MQEITISLHPAAGSQAPSPMAKVGEVGHSGLGKRGGKRPAHSPARVHQPRTSLLPQVLQSRSRKSLCKALLNNRNLHLSMKESKSWIKGLKTGAPCRSLVSLRIQIPGNTNAIRESGRGTCRS